MSAQEAGSSAYSHGGDGRSNGAYSQLFSLAGRLYASTLELKESAQLPLASRLQFRALEIEGFLETAGISSERDARRAALSCALESIRKGQAVLDHALEDSLLSPEHFLELNAEWEQLALRLRRWLENMP